MGLSDGTIQGVRLNADGVMLRERWSCGVHDRDRGAVRQITSSWDGGRLFSCGDDSAIFSYILNSGKQPRPLSTPPLITPLEKVRRGICKCYAKCHEMVC